MRAIILQIPGPCSEKWSTMQDNDLGRHCPKCQTDIFDFTDLTDDELIEILKHAPAKVCGRFRASQIGRPIFIKEEKLKKYYNPRFKKMLAATVLLAASTSFLSAQDTVPEIKQPMQQMLQSLKAEALEEEKKTALSDYKIEGIVLDDTKEPLMGLEISIKGSNWGYMTDTDGRFVFYLPEQYLGEETVTYVFSYIGFETQEIKVKLGEEKEKLSKVIMKEDGNILIGEVIVVPYNKFYDPIYGR